MNNIYRPRIRWPRGKYNGDPITGFKVSFCLHLEWWVWRPWAAWNFGEPVFHLLCFTWRAEANYSAIAGRENNHVGE